MKPRFFRNPSQWRTWLAANHARKRELLVGLHRIGSGRPSMTWPESVDEALCFGWIDGVGKSIDASSYSIRFSSRAARSIWSRVNVAKAQALVTAGRMRLPGLEKFKSRKAARSGVYSFEQGRTIEFDPQTRAKFMRSARAWAFLGQQPPSYRKKVVWWIMSARQTATRERRTLKAIESFDRKKRIL